MNFSTLKKILIPSYSQILLYTLIAVVILVFVSFGAITDKIKHQAHFNEPVVKQAFETRLSGLNNIPALNIITIVIFWSTIGLIIYTVFWLGITMLTQARNEIVVETDYVNRGSLKDRIKIPLIQLGIFMVVLVVLIITLSVTFPTWIQFFGKFLLAIPADWTAGTTSLLLSVVGAVINIYILKVLVSVMLKVDQLMED